MRPIKANSARCLSLLRAGLRIHLSCVCVCVCVCVCARVRVYVCVWGGAEGLNEPYHIWLIHGGTIHGGIYMMRKRNPYSLQLLWIHLYAKKSTCILIYVHLYPHAYPHVYLYIHIYSHVYSRAEMRSTYIPTFESGCISTFTYGVAPISRLLQIIGLFCKRAL